MNDPRMKSRRPIALWVDYGERNAQLFEGVSDVPRKTSDFRSMAQLWRGYGA
jgi:hypothetical protein